MTYIETVGVLAAPVAAVLTAVIGFRAGTRSAKNAESSTGVESASVAVAAWKQLAEEYRGQQDRLKVEFESQKTEFSAQIKTLEKDLSGVVGQVKRLEQQAAEDRKARDTAVAERDLAFNYIATLQGVVLAAALQVPPPPAGLVLNGGR